MYWTIQHSSVLDAVEHDGIYKPDFSRTQLKCPMLCAFALRYFKLLNDNTFTINGVIFTFENTFEKPLCSLEDVKSFFQSEERYETILRHSITDVFNSKDYVLLCLDGYPSSVRTLPMDMVLYEMLDGNVSANGVVSYNSWINSEVQVAMLSWMREEFPGWAFKNEIGKSNVMQRCLPYITKANIKEIFDISKVIAS